MDAMVIGRDLEPRASSPLISGLTADCTQLEIGDYDGCKAQKHYDNLFYQIRPISGGNVVAIIVNPDHRPQMATVRSGVMKKALYKGGTKGEVVYPVVTGYVSPEPYVVKVLERHVEEVEHSLTGMPTIVAGGYGVGGKEAFHLLCELADVLHGEAGASRVVVDAGWIENDRQTGQTGAMVHPKVYIACGISGQIQYVIGIQNAGIVIAINIDADAPINQLTDYVITGSIEEVVPKMIKYYKENSK